jgi:hypothetical protein
MDTKLKIRTKVEDDSILSDEELAWKLHAELNTASPTLRTRSLRTKSNNLGGEGAEGAEGGEPEPTSDDLDGGDRKNRRDGKHERADTADNGGRTENSGRKRGVEKQSRGKRMDRNNATEASKKGRSKESGKMPRRSPRALETVEVRRMEEEEEEKEEQKDKVRVDDRKHGNRARVKSRSEPSKDGNAEEEGLDHVEGSRKGAEGAVEKPEVKPEVKPAVKKGRSRKGKPSVAAGGAVQEIKTGGGNKRGRSASKVGGKKPVPKIPKLPMVKEGAHWYRTRVLKETDKRIHVEFAGYEHTMPATWLPKFSERVWLGSYKGKDWRYQGDGAWVPKNGINNRIITVEDYDVDAGAVGKDAGGDIQDRSHRKRSRSGDKPNGPRDGAEDGRSVSADNSSESGGDIGIEEVDKADVSMPSGEGEEEADRELASKNRNLRARDVLRTGASNSNSENDPRANNASGGRKAARSRKRGASSESSKKQSGDLGGSERRHRPKRSTKKTALFNNADFSLEIDADSEGTNGNNLMESGATNQSSRRNQPYAANINVLDEEEQAALVALAEMPSSPACRFTNTEAMLEDSREALLEAYASRGGYTNGGGQQSGGGTHQQRSVGSSKRQWKRSFKSEPILRQSSLTSESISVAGQLFGGVMHAISARIGNGIHRTLSLPSTPRVAGTFGQSPRGWMPHVWTSGVTPADAEPAIIQVPTSLIEKALASPRYRQNDSTECRSPPVPLFY